MDDIAKHYGVWDISVILHLKHVNIIKPGVHQFGQHTPGFLKLFLYATYISMCVFVFMFVHPKGIHIRK